MDLKLVVCYFVTIVASVNANTLFFNQDAAHSVNDHVLADDSNGTVLDVLNKLNLTEFIFLADRAGMTKTLTTTANITALAPSQDAILALPLSVRQSLVSNSTFVKLFVAYHLLPKNYSTSNMTQDKVVSSFVTNSTVRFNSYASVNTINGVQLEKSNQIAKNGIVHVLEKALWPIPECNAIDEIKRTKMLATFASKIDAAAMGGLLNGSGPFTIFAPSDAAFKKDKSSETTKLVEYHVVSSPTQFHTGLLNKPTLTTLLTRRLGSNNETLSINVGKDGSITVKGKNSAKIITSDITVFNGVIHIIDTVLKHPFL